MDVFPTPPPGPSRGMAQAAWSLGGGEEGCPLGSGTVKVNVKSSEPRFQLGGFHSLSSWSGLNPSTVMLGHSYGFLCFTVAPSQIRWYPQKSLPNWRQTSVGSYWVLFGTDAGMLALPLNVSRAESPSESCAASWGTPRPRNGRGRRVGGIVTSSPAFEPLLRNCPLCSQNGRPWRSNGRSCSSGESPVPSRPP